MYYIYTPLLDPRAPSTQIYIASAIFCKGDGMTLRFLATYTAATRLKKQCSTAARMNQKAVRYLAVLLFTIVWCTFSYAKELAVMLFISDRATGDAVYQQHLHDIGLNRFMYYQGIVQSDYHVSLGYIDDVDDTEAAELSMYLTEAMHQQLANQPVVFEFGASSLLGRDTMFIVALPKNTRTFSAYNTFLHTLLQSYKQGKYQLKTISKPAHYIPHMTLNGRVGKEIPLEEVYAVLLKINQRMANRTVRLTKAVVR